MNKTYRDLLLFLQTLSDSQLDCNISVRDLDDEFIPVLDFGIVEEGDRDSDVLDPKHPYINLWIM